MSSIRNRLGLNKEEEQKTSSFSSSDIRNRLGITQSALEEEAKNPIVKTDYAPERQKTGLKWIDANLNNIDNKAYQNAQELSKYQNENVAVKLGSTIGDLATNVGKGLFNTVEGVVDLGRYGVAGVADILGAKGYANDVRERAKQDTTSIIFKPAEDMFNKNSMLKENGIIENVARGVGNVGAIIGSGALLPGKLATVNLGKFQLPTSSILTGAGSGMTEAYNNGASNEQAVSYGALSGLVEGFSESLFGGLGKTFSKKFGGGALDDVLVRKLTDKISNKTLKTLAETGIKSAGEGIEEVLSGLGSAISKKLTYMNKEDITKLINDEDLLNSFVVGALTSAVAQAPSTYKSIKVSKTLNNNQNVQETLPTFNQNTQNNINIPTTQNIVQKGLNLPSNTGLNVNQNINTNTNIDETIDPLKNLQEYRKKQQEIKNIKMQQETNNKIDNLTNQVEELQKKVTSTDKNTKLYNDFKQSQNVFSNQVDQVLNGAYPTQNMLIVSEQTPQVLRDIGLKNLPITMTQRHLKTIMNSNGEYKGANYHNLGVDLIKQLPQAIANPLNVLKSSTKPDSIVVITELADKQDRPIIASIKIDGKGQINDIEIDTNVLTSAYGKDNYDSFMKRNIANGNMIYDIDEDIKKRSGGKLQLRPTTSSTNDNTTNLAKSQMVLPTYNMQQNKESIPTAKDFINLPNVEKNSNINYNNSRSEIYEKRNNEATGRGNFEQSSFESKMEEDVSKREHTTEKYRQFEQKAKENEIKSYSKNQLELKNKIKTKYDKNLVFFDGDFDYDGGASLSNSKNIFISNNINEKGQNFVAYHEIMESELLHNIEFKNNYGSDAINEIINDKNFYEMRKEFIGDDVSLNKLSDYMIAKDIYADIFAEKNTGIDKGYKTLLSDNTIQIINYSIERLNSNYNKSKENLPKNPTKESSYDDFKETKKTRKEVQQEIQDEMGITIDDLSAGKDISSIAYQRTDPIRLNEKVFGAEIGKKINDATINKTKHNEAERIRFLNQERDEIKNLGIKPRSKESAAVQKYGEKQYINDKGDVITYSDANLAAEFPNIENQQKIKKAAEAIRNKYDKYIDTINQTITELGYDPIPKRKDYMRHFQELNDKFTQWGLPLNRQSLNENNIPTDINGLTDQFKPGKNWFASAMQRKGLKTTYDAITGIDGYLEGASNLMYHTEDIQRYRALSKLVRDTFGQTHGLDNVDLSTEEGQKRLNDIYDNKLSKYAAWLDEQANALAGKKGAIDRGAERVLGRRIYSVLDAAKKQVGSNMTGFNVRSALTNFASAVQGASKTNKLAFIKGTLSTVKNIVHNDGLINKSDFLTSRFGSDQLSKKPLQKASNAGQILMSGSDYFTANQIWRSKYYENLSKGMSESQAIKNADDFAARIMGDRSKGATAEIFNSKTLGLLTQFQLEVNNQWSSMIHDNKMDIKNGNKTGATVLFQLGQLAAMSYLFNNFMKSMTGSDVMIDPIDMLKKIFGSDDDDKSLEERAQEVLGDVVNDLPFASFLTGGRIPVAEAFTGASIAFKKITGQKDKYGNDIKWSDVKDDAISSAFYWLLPTGYGQAKKTTQGLSMYDSRLPMPGSYTNSGNLRFRADESTSGKVKAALFGQYSSEESQKYREEGYKAISKARLDEIKNLNMTASEYRKYREKLNEAGTKNADKIDFIANSNYTNEQKNIMAKNVLGKDFDINEYNKYDSYDEYDYATKNPDKYSVIKQITSYDKYSTYKDKLADIRNNTTNDKTETIKYINSLPLSIPQKAIFIKQYYKSYTKYDKEIVEYVKQNCKTQKEREQVLRTLGFTIKDGRVYY